MNWKIDRDSSSSHVMGKYVAVDYKTMFFFKWGESHSHALPQSIHAIASIQLGCDILVHVRKNVGANASRLVDYAFFAQNKFESLLHST